MEYSIGNSDLQLGKNVVNKILDIQKLNPEDKGHVFAMLDAFLQSQKLRKCSLHKTIKPQQPPAFISYMY